MESKKRMLGLGLILIVLFGRFAPHPPNFTPIVAVALFSTFLMNKRFLALLVPAAAFWISDLVLNNVVYSAYFEQFTFVSESFLWSVSALALIVLAAKPLMKKIKASHVILGALMGSTIFFLVSNFGVWATGFNGYPPTASGLGACYLAGIPFFLNSIAGDLLYSGLLFGTYAWTSKRWLAKESAA